MLFKMYPDFSRFFCIFQFSRKTKEPPTLVQTTSKKLERSFATWQWKTGRYGFWKHE
jgi:hypothetical protein